LAIRVAKLGFEDARLAAGAEDLYRDDEDQDKREGGTPHDHDQANDENHTRHVDGIANPIIDPGGHKLGSSGHD